MEEALYFKNESWSFQLCEKLFKMKTSEDMCDVRLQGKDGESIAVHSCLLAAASPFLYKYISEFPGSFKSNQDVVVQLSNVSSASLHHIIRFLYCGEMFVPNTELVDVKNASQYLQFQELTDMVQSFVQPVEVQTEETGEEFIIPAGSEDESQDSNGVDTSAITDIPQETLRPSIPDSEAVSIPKAEHKPDLESLTVNTQTLVSPTDQCPHPQILDSVTQSKTEEGEDEHFESMKTDSAVKKEELQTIEETEEELPTEVVHLEQLSNTTHTLIDPDTYQFLVNSGQILEGYNPEIAHTLEFQGVEEGEELVLTDDLPAVEAVDETAMTYLEMDDTLTTEQQVEQQYSEHLESSEGFTPSASSLKSIIKPRSNYSRPEHLLHPVKCQYCSQEFARKHELETHLMELHGDPEPYSCDHCGRKFKYRSSMKSHTLRHGEKLYACHSCNKTFHTKSDVASHMRSHFGTRPFQCEICQKAYSTRSVLLKHRVKVHNEQIPGVDMEAYTCPQCGKGFPLNCELKQHVKIIHGQHYQCQTCQQTFHLRKELKAHIQEQHGGEGEITKAPDSALPTHYACYICKKKMRCPSAVQRHLENAHQKVKRYFCEVEGCGYRTYWPYDMEIHKKRHTTSTKLAKQINKVTYEDNSVDVSSMYETGTEDGKKTWKCLKCPRKFRTQSAVIIHCEGVHCNIKRYFCQIPGCSYGTYRKSDLQTHLMRHKCSKRLENRLGTEPVTEVTVSEKMLDIPTEKKRGRPRKRPAAEMSMDDSQMSAGSSLTMKGELFDMSSQSDYADKTLDSSSPDEKPYIIAPSVTFCHCCGMEVIKTLFEKHLEKCQKQ